MSSWGVGSSRGGETARGREAVFRHPVWGGRVCRHPVCLAVGRDRPLGEAVLCRHPRTLLTITLDCATSGKFVCSRYPIDVDLPGLASAPLGASVFSLPFLLCYFPVATVPNISSFHFNSL